MRAPGADGGTTDTGADAGGGGANGPDGGRERGCTGDGNDGGPGLTIYVSGSGDDGGGSGRPISTAGTLRGGGINGCELSTGAGEPALTGDDGMAAEGIDDGDSGGNSGGDHTITKGAAGT